LFTREDGTYLIDDNGNILQTLDFGIFTAGSSDEPIKVVLKNMTGWALRDIELWVENPVTLTTVDIDTDFEFTNTRQSIKLLGQFSDGATQDIYIRPSADRHAKVGGTFKLYTRGTLVMN
jgi:hypothetical protein